jgi:hypothetical protein
MLEILKPEIGNHNCSRAVKLNVLQRRLAIGIPGDRPALTQRINALEVEPLKASLNMLWMRNQNQREEDHKALKRRCSVAGAMEIVASR